MAGPQPSPSARALKLLDQLHDQESPFRKQLCVAVQRINMQIVTERQRPLTQVRLPVVYTIYGELLGATAIWRRCSGTKCVLANNRLGSPKVLYL